MALTKIRLEDIWPALSDLPRTYLPKNVLLKKNKRRRMQRESRKKNRR